MLRFVRFFYTLLYTRTGSEGTGDVGVLLLIVSVTNAISRLLYLSDLF